MSAMKPDLQGLKDFQRQLNSLTEKVQTLNADPPIEDVLTDKFMRSHTSVSSFAEMLETVGITTQEQFEEAPESLINSAVRAVSQYESLSDLLASAAVERLMD